VGGTEEPVSRFVSILALVLLLAGPVSAELTEEDEARLREWMAAWFNPYASDRSRARSLNEVSKFFAHPRRRGKLADVDGLSRLLARSAVRPSQRPGVHDRTLKLSDLGADSKLAYRYVVSVPDGYRGDLDADPWPLILCIPDEKEDPFEYLDRYWGSDAVRAQYLIAVLDFPHESETVERAVEEWVGGKLRLRLVRETVPFTWDSSQAAMRFWANLFNLQVREFKVDPDRIVLDGAGVGARGAQYFAGTTARVFAGLISRGVPVDESLTTNLSHLAVRVVPGGVEEEHRAWLASCVRDRYPLPCSWVYVDDAAEIGYWMLSTRRDRERPVATRISSDRDANVVEITARNVGELTLFLNDRLVDLDRPFEVRVNGHRVCRRKLTRSPDHLLGHAMVGEDGRPPSEPGVVFTAEISTIEVPEVTGVEGPPSGLLGRLLVVLAATGAVLLLAGVFRRR
jgi:hypothetical protein